MKKQNTESLLTLPNLSQALLHRNIERDVCFRLWHEDKTLHEKQLHLIHHGGSSNIWPHL